MNSYFRGTVKTAVETAITSASSSLPAAAAAAITTPPPSTAIDRTPLPHSSAVSFDSDDIVKTFSPEQTRAFDAYLSRKNVFITGPGGYGKSYLIKAIVHHANRDGRAVSVCAMTGCAAVLLDCDATTLHGWARIGIARGAPEDILTFLVRNKHCAANWRKTDLLIVDEVSMMSKYLFNLFNHIAQGVRRNRRPFGGIQLIFCGDFFQLPPVGDEECPDSDRFCFESDQWNDTFHEQIELRTPFRHKDETFAHILHELRTGKIRRSSYELIMSRVGLAFDPAKHHGVRPVTIVPLRGEAQTINEENLRSLEGEEYAFNATFEEVEVTGAHTARAKYLPREDREKEETRMLKSLIVDKTLKLKVGAQVMCIKNMADAGLVNGSTGIVTGFVNGYPRVRYYNGTEIVMTRTEWKNDKYAHYGIKQVPLILAWAITIHKSQGATLDLAEINAGSSIFACGQTYVAMSRVRTLEGLYLTSFAPDKVKINKRVLEFYARLSAS
jgi:ATP-dependent DNA helicase PIF1